MVTLTVNGQPVAAPEGTVLLEAMRRRTDRELTVLCGHTHGEGTARILPNLLVYTGGARYAHPRIQRTFDLH